MNDLLEIIREMTGLDLMSKKRNPKYVNARTSFCIVASYKLGKTQEEIADVLQISRGAVAYMLGERLDNLIEYQAIEIRKVANAAYAALRARKQVVTCRFLSANEELEQFKQELKALLVKFDVELIVDDFERDWNR